MKELLRFIPYLKKHKSRVFIGLFFVSLSNLTAAIVPGIVGRIIDSVTEGNFTQSKVLEEIFLILLLTAAGGLFMFITRQTIIVASRLIEYELRRDLLNAIEYQPMSFFHTNQTGQLMAYATNDVTAAREFLGPALMYSANTITTFVFVLYFMLNLNLSVSLMALAPLPLIAAATYLIGKKVHSSFRDVQSQYADLTAQSQESISGIRVIKAFVKEENELKKFKDISREYLDKNLKLARIQTLTMPIITVLVGLSLITLLLLGGREVIAGRATLGDLTQFFIYLGLLIWPVAAIGWITNLVQRASASAGRLGSILDKKPELLDTDKTDRGINSIGSDVIFRNVSFTYPNNSEPVLSNVSLDISQGSFVGIAGVVGSGKSTLLQLLYRLYELDSGEILIGGRNISSIPIHILRGEIGVVPQDTFLFSDSILENIRLGKPDVSLEEIIEICKAVRIDEEINSFPDKYESILGERGITLSGGQKQRVALARALIRKPKLLILDDAFSAVDIEAEIAILDSIKQTESKPTIILITHRLNSIKSADKIVLFDNGEIVESGTHSDLMNAKGQYASMYEKQMLEEELSGID